MANTIASQTRNVAPWDGRAVIVIQETDGDEYRYHGVMVGPPGMLIEDALARLDAAYIDGREKGGEDWNYDDVIAEMRAAGFEEVLAAEWWEGNADVPEDKETDED
jgi:hypothetical protein